MKRTIRVERMVPLLVVVECEREWDDDGCGSPSVTGNSMTGCRGSQIVPLSIEDIYMPIDAEIMELVNADDQDVLDAVAEAEADDDDDKQPRRATAWGEPFSSL